MKIPLGPSGFPTVSPNSLRAYGSAGFDWADAAEPRGCPRQWKARYVDKSVRKNSNVWLRMGRVIHKALQLMEELAIGPEEALEKAWDIALPAERYAEALQDLRAYLERPSSPLDRYGTWATEVRLDAELYVDEVEGPIHIQGIVDRIAIDPDTPDVIHVHDWKWGYQMFSLLDVKKSNQLKTYAYLVMGCWELLKLPRKPRAVIVHLDQIKWRELAEVRYSEADMEAWHFYTIAVVRTILRDEEAEPKINEGCAHCPVRDDCPAFQGIADLGLRLLKVKPAVPDGEATEQQIQEHADALVTWREQAHAVQLLLEKAVKEIDGRFVEDAIRLGEVRAGGWRWVRQTQWANRIDLRRLHSLIGDQFYDEASITKTRLEQLQGARADLDVMACLGREPVGTNVKRSKE